MPSSSDKFTISPAQFKSAWRKVTIAGSLGTIWGSICLSSAPRTKFLSDLGATPYHFGIMAALGSLCLAFQLLSGIVSSRLQWRKPIWMFVTITHRLLLFGVIAAPFLFVHNTTLRLAWVIGVLFVHDAMMQFGGPFWFSWMADLVPMGSMSRNWASRQRVTMLVNIISSVLIAESFSYFEDSNRVVLGFGLIGGIGIALGVVDILLFTSVPDVPNDPDSGSGVLKTIIQPLRDADFRRYTVFVCYWIFGIMLAAPFMQIFQMEFLKQSAFTVQMILTANIIGVVIVSRFWGLVCDTYGERPTIFIATLGKAFIPLAMFLAPRAYPRTAVAILAGAMLLDGIVSGGVMLALQSYLFKIAPRRHRTIYIGSNNFFQGLAMGAAAYLGGKYIEVLNHLPAVHLGIYTFNGYHAIFAVSFLLRLSSVYLVRLLREEGSTSVQTLLLHLKSTNSFGVVRTVYRLSDSQDDEIRLSACRRLGQFRSPLAIRQLIDALEDETLSIRHAAADALGNIGMSEASEPLARALMDGRSGIQSPAARALGQIGDFTSLKALLTNLRKLEPEALGETIDSLVRIGDSASILPLISLFDEVKDPALRDKIAAALGELSETSSLEVMSLLSMGRPRQRRI